MLQAMKVHDDWAVVEDDHAPVIIGLTEFQAIVVAAALNDPDLAIAIHGAAEDCGFDLEDAS